MTMPPPPFVGRGGPLATFDASWASLTPQDRAALVFHGLGGVGKSRLLRELATRLGTGGSAPAAATIDFADPANHDAAKALERARVQYRASAGVRFPSFDIAFAAYWRLANPGTAHEFDGNGLFDPAESTGAIALAVASAAEDLPGLSPLVKVPRLVVKGSSAVKRWWTERGEADLQEIRTLTEPLEVARHLPRLFAADLAAWSDEDPTRRAALFADTLDHLYRGALPQTAGSTATSWFGSLVADLRGVLVVGAARVPPPWATPPVSVHPLDALSPTEADALLRNGGMVEPDLRRTLAGADDEPGRSRGVPLYLTLALDAYHAALAATGVPPAAADFSIDLQGLLDLVLSYADQGVRAAVYLLAVPRTFDRDLFRDLVREFQPGIAATSQGLQRLSAYSFVTEPEPGRFAFHDLVRDAAVELQDPGDVQDTLSFLLLRTRDVLEAIDPRAVTDADRRALYDWVQYTAVYPIEDFLDQYWNAEEVFHAAGEWRLLSTFREAIAAHAQAELGDDHPATLTALHNHAHLLSQLGDFAAAEALYETVSQARAAHPDLGPDHPETLSALNGLASSYTDREDHEAAAKLHRRVLQARERTLPPDHPHTATSLNNLAVALKELGRLNQAETYYRRALRWRERHLGEGDPETITSMNNLAAWHSAKGDRPAAGRLLKRAYALATAHLAEAHPVRLGAANGLGSWHLTSASPERGAEAALPYLYEALEGRRDTLGDAHPTTLRSVANTAIALAATGVTDEAEVSLVRALDLATEAYGPDYSVTRMLRHNLEQVRHAASEGR